MMFSAYSGPFLEENDDSRRAVKPIVAKDQAYDGQTQRTEQAMVSSAAVQAEPKTVSDSVEDNTLGPITTSLISFDPNICYNLFLHKHNIPLLHYPQTLHTFTQHLQYNNFTKPFKVSVNLTYTETHVYTNYNDILLPNHTLLTYHQYSTYYQLPLKSFSNDITNNSMLKLNITTHNVQGYNT